MCTDLHQITLPKKLKEISKGLFSRSGLKEIEIPDSVTTIGDGAFAGVYSLTSITIPENVTKIGSSAFSGTGLTSVVVPGSVPELGWGVFGDCYQLESVVFEEGFKAVTNDCFGSFCFVKTIALPANLEEYSMYEYTDFDVVYAPKGSWASEHFSEVQGTEVRFTN